MGKTKKQSSQNISNEAEQIWGEEIPNKGTEKLIDYDLIEDTTTPTQDGTKVNEQLADIFLKYKEGTEYRNMVDNLAIQIVPIKNERDPSWEATAQNFLKATILSVLYNPKTTLEKFTIGKIKIMCGMGDFSDDPSGNFSTKPQILYRYFKQQPLICRQLADAVVNNSYNTAKNHLSVLYTYLAKY